MMTPGSMPRYRVSVPGDVLAIAPIADLHVGGRTCSTSRVERVVRSALAADALCVGLGDYVEGIAPGDKRWDVTSIRAGADPTDLIPEQFRDAASLLAPLKGRWVGACMGNHEEKWLRVTGVASIWREFLALLGAEDLQYAALVSLDVWFRDPDGRRRKRRPPDRVVTLALHHGAGAGRTPGAKIGRVVDWGHGLDGVDVVLWGHAHALASWWEARMRLAEDRTHLVDRPIACVSCGTTSRTYEAGPAGYGERAAYRPAPLGRAIVRVYHDEIGVETIA